MQFPVHTWEHACSVCGRSAFAALRQRKHNPRGRTCMVLALNVPFSRVFPCVPLQQMCLYIPPGCMEYDLILETECLYFNLDAWR